VAPTATATATALPTGAPAWPLKVSANGRYLVGQNGIPFLVVGDSPQSLIGNLSEADAATYFANRHADGFNAVWINLLCDSYTFCNSNGTTYDGIAPFTTSGDLSTPNPAYFQRVDDLIRLAAQYGLTVFLDPAETGGWLGTLRGNGVTKDQAYGAFLGNRYKSFPNIVWMSGNDFQSWGNASDDAVVQAVANGIKSADSTHLQTTELNYLSSGSLDDPSWGPLLGLDGAYTYYPTYAQVLKEYNRSTIPVFMEEANYEFENNNNLDTGTPNILRRQEYWTMLSGATGQIYGNHYTATFTGGWQSNLDTPGTRQLGYGTALFAPRAWYNLVPDQNHSVVTAGYGTFASSGSLGANDYLTAARTPDGSLVLAYMPTSRTITVDMTKLSGPITARWYDPANGIYSPISGSPFANSGNHQFTPPGNNSAGDSDWVLVLEAGSSSTPSIIPLTPGPTDTPVNTSGATPAFIQVNSVTPQSSQQSVSATFTGAQAAGDSNVVVIGWNDTTSTITSVTDSHGNIYQVAAATTRGSGVSQAIYYAKQVAAAGAGTNTVTVTFNQGAAAVDLRILEYGGLDQMNPFDVSASAAGNTNIANSGTAVTTSANELIVGAGTTVNAFNAAGAGFTTRVLTSPDGDIAEDQVVTSSGSYSATAPQYGAGAWVMQLVAFR